MRQVIALAVKDLQLMLHDKAGLFFTCCFPLLVAIFFGTILSGTTSEDRTMRVAVADEDGTEGSRGFVSTLAEAREVDVVPVGREEATTLVRRGNCVAYVVLPAGFGEARRRMFWGEPPKIETGIDPSRRAEAAMLQGILTKYMFEGMQDTFSDREKMREHIEDARAALREGGDEVPFETGVLERFLGELERFWDEMPAAEGALGGWEPLVIESTDVARKKWEGPERTYDFTFPQGIMWGLLASAATFGISLVVERTEGTLVRLRVAPITRAHILAGKAVACFVTTLSVSGVLLAIGIGAFGLRPHSFLLLALAVCSAAVAFVGIMMLLSVLGKTERSAGGIGWAILVSMAMVGGGSIPLFFMPSWLQAVSNASPVKWAILALEGAIWRGFSLAEMALPCGILIGVGVVFFAVGVRAFRWMESG